MEGTQSDPAMQTRRDMATDLTVPMQVTQNCDLMKGDGDDLSYVSTTHVTDEPNSSVPPLAGVTRPKPLTLSPDQQGRWPHKSPSSPECAAQRSPLQCNSPASLIFERNVQEDILLPQTSPSIPSHIRTENYIPPVLEASSAAITDSELDPDSVEIVTHSGHHTAVGGVTPAENSLNSSWHEGGVVVDTHDSEELLSSTRGLDMADIRRLSFISFADVVNAEHAETSEHPTDHNSFQGITTTSSPSAMAHQNIPLSPLHSPASSHGFGTSPPTSISTSFKGLDLSPNRGSRGAESPLLTVQRSISPNLSGELNIETMRQALRRTGSRELGPSRSQMSSTVASDD